MLNVVHVAFLALVTFLFGNSFKSNISANQVINPTPMAVISISPTPITKVIYPTYNNVDNSLHDCVINGQVLQLTYSECQHQLNLQLAKDEQNEKYYEQKLQNMPSAQQIMDQTAKDIKNYYDNLPPTITLPPLQTYQAPTPIVSPTTPPQTITNTNMVILCGRINANCTTDGFTSSSGVCKSRLAQAGCL